MSKKLLVIVGLAAIIAASGGVVLTNQQAFVRGADADPVSDVVIVDDHEANAADDDIDIVEQDADSDVDSDNAVAANTDAEDEGEEADVKEDDSSPTYTVQDDPREITDHQGDEAQQPVADSSVQSYSIQKIIDHSTGQAVSPRVVLGSFAGSCYLKLYDSGKIDLYINPSSGTVQHGTYQTYDQFISVLFDTGVGTEYPFIAADDGSIDMIVVNSGDYDIYFG